MNGGGGDVNFFACRTSTDLSCSLSLDLCFCDVSLNLPLGQIVSCSLVEGYDYASAVALSFSYYKVALGV